MPKLSTQITTYLELEYSCIAMIYGSEEIAELTIEDGVPVLFLGEPGGTMTVSKRAFARLLEMAATLLEELYPEFFPIARFEGPVSRPFKTSLGLITFDFANGTLEIPLAELQAALA